MVSRFTERDNVRDRARGQSASYAPTTRNQRREPNRFVQEVKKFGNNAGQMGSNFSGALQNNPVTNTIQKGVNYGREKMLPGLVGAGLAGIKDVFNNQIMNSQNRNYFGGNMLHNKIPDNVRESMMTQKNQDFYDKYINLASMAQDTKKRDEYLKTAETARTNSQNTARLNYALSQIDDNSDNEYMNSAGLPSYSQDLFGEGQGRLNMDAFREAMGRGEGILGGLSEEDRNGEVIDSYSQQTFRPNMADVAGPVIYPQDKPINTDMSKNKAYNDLNQAEIDYLMGRKDSITDEEMNIPEPFDDSAREQGIMDQQYQSPIGPRDNPFRRPNMMDVSGRGINRGLFPYPGYDRELVGLEQQGRGELPNPNAENLPYDYDLINRDFDYNQSNKDRVDNYRLDQILGRMRPEEVEEVGIFSARDR